jgi:CRISPR/Cas system CSM-associated protein Csm2 small subunit
MGISEYRDGSSIPAKTGLGVMQQQVQSSNNATEYIYQSCVHLLEETGMKISMMLWDSIVLKAKKFKEFEGYEMSLLDMTFDVRVNMVNDDQSRAELNQLMNTALAAGAITYEQAFKIKNIEDVKLAELYLARSMKKAKKEAQEVAQQNAQMNAQIQQQSAAAKAEGDAQLEQMMAESKIAVNKSKTNGDKEIELIKFATAMYTSVVGKGIELPADIKQFADSILGNAIQPQLQEQAMQEQAAMEQQMIAEQGAPEQVTEEQITEEIPPQ